MRRKKIKRKRRINILKLLRLLFIIFIILTIIYLGIPYITDKKINADNIKSYINTTSYNDKLRSFNNSLYIKKFNKKEGKLYKLNQNKYSIKNITNEKESYIWTELSEYLKEKNINEKNISLIISDDNLDLFNYNDVDIKEGIEFYKLASIVEYFENLKISLNENVKIDESLIEMNSKFYNKTFSRNDILRNIIKNGIVYEDKTALKILIKYIDDNNYDKSIIQEIIEKKHYNCRVIINILQYIRNSKNRYDTIFNDLLYNEKGDFIRSIKTNNAITYNYKSENIYYEIGVFNIDKKNLYYLVKSENMNSKYYSDIGNIILRNLDKINKIDRLYY